MTICNQLSQQTGLQGAWIGEQNNLAAGEPAWTASTEEGTRRFWRNVFAGSARVRFHQVGACGK